MTKKLLLTLLTIFLWVCFLNTTAWGVDETRDSGIYLELSKEELKTIQKGHKIGKYVRYPGQPKEHVQIGIYIQKKGADENYTSCPRCNHEWFSK